MTEFKGTQGPYATRANSGDGLTIGALRVVKGAEIFISLGHSAAVRNPGYLHGQEPIEREEAEANAVLWAAAQELLAVAQMVLTVDDDWKALSLDQRSRVEAAIARATSTEPRSA